MLRIERGRSCAANLQRKIGGNISLVLSVLGGVLILKPCFTASVQNDPFSFGRWLLMERINHPDSPIKHMVLDTEMILWESTAFNLKKFKIWFEFCRFQSAGRYRRFAPAICCSLLLLPAVIFGKQFCELDPNNGQMAILPSPQKIFLFPVQ